MAGLGAVAVAMIAFAMIHTIKESALPLSLAKPEVEGSTLALGHKIFTQFALPFEVLSLLLLVAMIGTVLLSKRDLK
jgi:NADH-quinone oxidoreductase subunit J